MSTLHVIAIIEAKPESVDNVRAALRTLVEATRAEEGCITYDLSESLATPGAFVTVEEWRSQDDLDKHMASPHIATAFATIGDLLASQPTIHPLTPVDV